MREQTINKITAIIILAVVLLGCVAFCVSACAPQAEDTTYTLTAHITETHDELVVCVDAEGNEWGFYADSDAWYAGDTAILTIHAHGTESVHDDAVIDAQHAAH